MWVGWKNESSVCRTVERRLEECPIFSYIDSNRRSYISQLKICMYMKTKGCEYKPLIGYLFNRPTIRQPTVKFRPADNTRHLPNISLKNKKGTISWCLLSCLLLIRLCSSSSSTFLSVSLALRLDRQSPAGRQWLYPTAVFSFYPQ